MTRFKSVLCAALVLSFAGGTAVPLSAAPLPAVQAIQSAAEAQTPNVVKVGHRDRRHWRGGRGWHRGHRGYRHRRHGYRYRDGFWFPPAAFITGAIIGNALSDRRAVRVGNRHVRWCENRYRSYRAWDNTFQPYNGPRRQCNSPYN